MEIVIAKVIEYYKLKELDNEVKFIEEIAAKYPELTEYTFTIINEYIANDKTDLIKIEKYTSQGFYRKFLHMMCEAIDFISFTKTKPDYSSTNSYERGCSDDCIYCRKEAYQNGFKYIYIGKNTYDNRKNIPKAQLGKFRNIVQLRQKNMKEKGKKYIYDWKTQNLHPKQ